MRRQPRRDLQEFLRQRVADLTNAAALGRGEIAEAELAAAERLDRLTRLKGSLRRDYRLRVLVIAAGLLIALFALLWRTRLSETDITLQADVSEMTFTLQRTQPLLEPLALVSLSAAGLAAIEVPQKDGRPPKVHDMTREGRHAVMVRRGDGRRDSLTLNAGGLPAGTRVWLSIGDRSRSYRLSLLVPADGEILATARGSVTVRVPEFRDTMPFLDTPRPIRLVFGRQAADLALEVRGDEAVRLRPEMPITHLGLQRVPQHTWAGSADDAARSTDSGIRTTSTLISGTIVFERLPGKQVSLHSGQKLVLAGLKDAQLLDAVLERDRIHFTLRGTVRGLRLEQDSAPHDLMPNRIEYLQGQGWVTLGFAGLGLLLSLLGVIAQWQSWRSR